MKLENSVSLAEYSTMRLGGRAAHLVRVASKEELAEALNWAKQQNLSCLSIGSGSNIVWRDEGYTGLVIVNEILGYEVVSSIGSSVYLRVGSGEMLDSVVARSVKANLTGIEGLSLIPGKVGAMPIQNVGAYGQETSDTLVTLEAYDSKEEKFVVIPASECAFGYRTSRFKTADKGRFFIYAVTLNLTKADPAPPFYAAVASYFEAHDIRSYTPALFREAVINIRQSKLPDPNLVANVGSFFANPVITEGQFIELKDRFETIPQWPAGEGLIKLSAAWLIEQVGFKDIHDQTTGMATWPTQPLVLINEHAKSTADLLNFKQKIVEAVKSKFDVSLVQEPELLP